MVNLLILAGGILLFVLIIYRLHVYHKTRLPTAIPGPIGLPIVGSALQIKPERVHHQFYDFANLYGEIFKIQIFDTDTVVLNSVELIQKAFLSDGQFFNDRPNLFLAKHAGLIDSLTMRHLDKEHRLARKAFVKHLHMYGNGVSKFENVIQGEITRLLKEIASYDSAEFEVTELVKRSIMDVVSILLIGKEATADDMRNFFIFTEGGDFFMNALTNTVLSNWPSLLHLPFYKRRMKDLLRAKRMIHERYFYQVKETTSTGNGIVQELLQDSEENKLPTEIIKSMTLVDVLSAGVLTTSSLLPSIILCLVNHPEYQSRLQEELDSIIGKSRCPCISDKQACVFLEAVVMETARLILPGPFWVPHVCKQDRVLDGYNIKANTQVLANAWYVHHDETIWGDPWNFRPERFLDDDGKLLPKDHKFIKNWIPFGVGLRRCPGMGMALSRIFLYISNIFQMYTLLPVQGKCGSCDPRTEDFIFEMFVKPKTFFCVARKRHDARTAHQAKSTSLEF